MIEEIELEPVEVIAAEIARTGEDEWENLYYECECQRLEQKLSDFSRAVAKVKNPDDPRLQRAAEIMAQLTIQLDACLWLFLKTWRPDRHYPN